jgi:hypothetical protein
MAEVDQLADLSYKEPIMGMFAPRSDGQRSGQEAVIHHNELFGIKRPFAACDKLDAVSLSF